MQQITIIYWRDIPAQVIVGAGRKAAKRPLPERFEQAIDRAAMRTGASGTDEYLADFRKEPAGEAEGDAAEVAAAAAERIDREYDAARLKALIENDGRA
ncbi:virulence factor [Pseudoroseicyclus sp. H15]